MFFLISNKFANNKLNTYSVALLLSILYLSIFNYSHANYSSFLEKRIALVIGNSSYKYVTKLRNPVHDAKSISGMLQSLHFDVLSGYDLDRLSLEQLIRNFAKKLENADVGFVFYAGHAVQINLQNYIIPVNANIHNELELKTSAVPLDIIMTALKRLIGLRIIILDACRNNPLKHSWSSEVTSRSIPMKRGLAIINFSEDILIGYSTNDNSVALDGDGNHSPYTQALLNHLSTPGLDVRLMLGRVRDEVMKNTSNKQKPFTYGSLGGREWAFKPIIKPTDKNLPKAPVKIDIAPHYRIIRKSSGDKAIIASINDLEYKIELHYPYIGLEHVGDFTLNGLNEAFVSVGNGGNCCPLEFLFILYKGNGNFHITDKFVNAWHTPKIEIWRDRFSIVAVVANEGYHDNLRKKETLRFIIDTTGNVKQVESKSKQYIRAISEFFSKDVAKLGTGQLSFDINDDGKKEHLTCDHWKRWGLMTNCKLFNDKGKKIQEIPIQCKRIGFLSNKTNQVHDIVCDFDQIWYWSNGKYIQKE